MPNSIVIRAPTYLVECKWPYCKNKFATTKQELPNMCSFRSLCGKHDFNHIIKYNRRWQTCQDKRCKQLLIAGIAYFGYCTISCFFLNVHTIDSRTKCLHCRAHISDKGQIFCRDSCEFAFFI